MNRLNSRERILVCLLAGALFILGNWSLLGSFAHRMAAVKADIAAKRSEIRSMQALVAESEGAAARDAWLTSAQPKLGNPEQAGVQLLDQIKETARANEVLLENPELGKLDAQADYQSVSVQLTAKATWSGLVKFLHGLQSPERFIVLENVSLRVDPADAKRMNCRCKIAQWYAK